MSKIHKDVQRRVRAQARNRCGYGISLQKYILGLLEMEHIHPEALGGTNDEENLWLACRLCNGFKGIQTHARDPLTGRRVNLFNPRRQKWKRHFMWSADGTRMIGVTACGRRTVVALQLNNLLAVNVRREWVKAGWRPPEDED
jgi:HNH endonuclease